VFREAAPSVLAYLPQHIAEVAGLTLFAGVAISALPALLSGRSSALPVWSTHRVRLVAALVLLFGGGFAVLGFVIHPEPPGGLPQGHWGSRSDRLLLVPWLLIVAAIAGRNFLREIRVQRARRLHTGSAADSDVEGDS
jgi:hypothetical protein